METEAIFVAVLLAIACVGITGYYPGGIIVPGYLVFFVDQPLRIVGTILVAGLTVAGYRLASQYVILFGRRRFAFMLLLAAVLTLASFHWLPALIPSSLEFRVIGLVVPGLIANHMERQGILITVMVMLTVTVFAYFAMLFWQQIF